MSFVSSQIGARGLSAAFAVAQQARASAEQVRAAADRMRIEGTREVAPVDKLSETRADIRRDVMAERGVDPRELARMGAQARLEAEVSINRETEARARKAGIKATGVYLDLTA